MATSKEIEIHVPPQEVLKIGSFSVTETMISCAVTVVILILIAAVTRIFFIPRWRNEHRKKSGFRLLLEYLVNIFDGNAKEQTGHNGGFVGAFYFACSAFIFMATMLEMFSLRPATSDLSLTLVFGIMSFILIAFFGFKEKKAKRLLHYANPLFTLSDVVVPFSIALRMFGSVFCGYLIMHLIYGLLPTWLLATGIVGAIGNVMFTAFHALIQAYVFMFLSMCLINEASEVDEETNEKKLKKLKKLKNQRHSEQGAQPTAHNYTN